jgi:SAM-dependent methyltransferase
VSTEYALENSWEGGAGRLSTLEQTYDRATLPRLDALGVAPGARCLEVGAGAGSVARRLAELVGPLGHVLATDIDTSLLEVPDTVDVEQLDIRSADLPEASFDVVHARLVLNHLVEREAVLHKLVGALAIGGVLLIEEGDAFPTDVLDDGVHPRMLGAVWRGLGTRGTDVRFGRELPRLVSGSGALDEVDATCVVPVVEGGSAQADWLLSTGAQLRGLGLMREVSEEDFESWNRLLSITGRWFSGLALYQVSARRVR